MKKTIIILVSLCLCLITGCVSTGSVPYSGYWGGGYRELVSDPAMAADYPYTVEDFAFSSDGEYLIAGCPYYSLEAGAHDGLVIIYRKTPRGFLETKELVAGQDTRFGTSLSLSEDGNVLVVGAPGESGVGQILIYEKASGQDWGDPALGYKPVRILGSSLPGFGSRVEISGDGREILASIPGFQEARGHAEIFWREFSWSGEGETGNRVLDPPGLKPGDEFGYALAVSGDGSRILLSAPGSEGLRGSLYSMDRPADGWNGSGQVRKLPVAGTAERGRLGQSVSMDASGRVFFAGMPGLYGTGPATGYRPGIKILEWDSERKEYTQHDFSFDTMGAGYAGELSRDGQYLLISELGTSGAGRVTLMKAPEGQWDRGETIQTEEPEASQYPGTCFGYRTAVNPATGLFMVLWPLTNEGIGEFKYYEISR